VTVMFGEEREPEFDTKAHWEEIKDRKPLRQGQFVGEEGDRFYVALSEEEVYELSPVVYYIWLMCDGEHTVEQILDRFSEEAEMSREELVKPLLLVLDSLSRVNLVKYL